MKIALLGYGKMGHEIESVALEQGHSIHITIDNLKDWEEKTLQFKDCDVAIDFTMPATAMENAFKCLDIGIPTVIGTTGWYDKLDALTIQCQQKNGSVFYASNFSIGVNIFFEINRRLSALMQSYPLYAPSMIEAHHLNKLDSPSGTAITLANDIQANNNLYNGYSKGEIVSGKIPIQSIRSEGVIGTHIVKWTSAIDEITIAHDAKSRRGFAIGAVMAASWLIGKKGVFTMKDLLNL